MGSNVGDGHRSHPSRRACKLLSGATARSGTAQVIAQPVQRDQGLGIRGLGEDDVEIGKGTEFDIDAFVLLDLGPLVDVGDAGGEEQVDDLVGEARGRVEGAEGVPVPSPLADLLGELTAPGLERVFAFDVELAGGDLQQVGHSDRLARLADEPQPLVVVEDDDADRAGVGDQLTLADLTILVAERVPPDGDELALEQGLGLEALEVGAHATAASSRRVNATSSIESSAATDTRSVGSWLCSVPLATLTVGMPAASNTFASEAPPVAIRFGS